MTAHKPLLTREVVTQDWRAPTVPEGQTLVFDEPGRVMDRRTNGGGSDVCYRSYWFRVTRWHSALILRIKHGGGEESQPLGYVEDAIHTILHALDSDARFFVLWELYDARKEGAKQAAARTAASYSQAFVDGRLKKRKRRGTSTYDVWIEAKQETAP